MPNRNNLPAWYVEKAMDPPAPANHGKKPGECLTSNLESAITWFSFGSETLLSCVIGKGQGFNRYQGSVIRRSLEVDQVIIVPEHDTGL